MLERVAVFVDAGYFWVQVSYILYGEKRPRENISLDAKLMRESLIREVKREFPDHSLLRIYWYDSLKIDGQQSSQHKTICRLDDIKMRYGTLNSRGQQKGVDGLLIADLINLAQNGAIGSALIVSGDADLAPGVSAAQMFGVRVHRLEISGQDASPPILVEEVDRNYEWALSEIQNFARKAAMDSDSEPTAHPGELENNQPASGASTPTLDDIARSFVDVLDDSERQILKETISIPPEFDRKLLFAAREGLKRFLGSEEKKVLRSKVRALLP